MSQSPEGSPNVEPSLAEVLGGTDDGEAGGADAVEEEPQPASAATSKTETAQTLKKSGRILTPRIYCRTRDPAR